MDLFLAPESWPFLWSVILLLGIAAVEGLALLFGFTVFGGFDDFSPEAPEVSVDGLGHWFDAWLGWLHIGKVPLLVVVVILLTAFSIAGFVLNGVAYAIFGVYPPVFVSVAAAFLGALPVVRVSSATLARLIPRDETSAESLGNLVGKVGVIVNGTARMNYPAQARVKNDHGQTLYVHIEPDDENLQFVVGDSVLLVKQISGVRFLAIANPRPELL